MTYLSYAVRSEIESIWLICPEHKVHNLTKLSHLVFVFSCGTICANLGDFIPCDSNHQNETTKTTTSNPLNIFLGEYFVILYVEKFNIRSIDRSMITEMNRSHFCDQFPLVFCIMLAVVLWIWNNRIPFEETKSIEMSMKCDVERHNSPNHMHFHV